MKPRLFPTALPAVLLAAWFAAAPAHATPPTGFTVDPSMREQSRVLYNTVYQASAGVPSGWTGDVSQGVAGTTSQAFQDAIVLRVNYFRAMAGVPATIALSDDFNAQDQQAALMMSANGTTDHYPTTGWIDYTADGAQAAGASNLALGTLLDGPAAIDAYLVETGANNTGAGHRRWVLYPPETLMGTGDVDGTADSAVLGSNALWILDTASFANPAPTPRDGFVAWPPPGYVPYALVAPRWSFSYPGADFSAASVFMVRQGNAVPVQVEALVSGAGDNTLVWVPDNEDPDNPPAPSAPAAEVPTGVTVSNVVVNGTAQTFTYTVTPFDPAQPGADTVYPVLGGPVEVPVGGAGAYTFDAVPNATGYRWTASGMTPLTLDLDAENGPGDVTITPPGASLVSTDASATGLASYHFNSFPAETLTPNVTFLPLAGSSLQFASELTYAAASETACVQISTDGGVSWTDLYAVTGNGGQTDTNFTTRSIDLSAYTGESCNVRFVYAYDGVGEYFPPGADTGWYVDDIRLTGAQTAAPASGGDLTAGQLGFSFQPAGAGTYALQVEPIFYGQYTADAGPLLVVTADDPGAGGGSPVSGLVTVAATVPQAQASTGTSGLFTLTRTGDLSRKVVVHFALKGSAANGTDYALIPGTAKIKAGRAGATVNIVPQAGAQAGKVKLVVLPGDGYGVGTPASAKVKIVP